MEFLELSDSITRPANATVYTALDVIGEVTTNDHFTFGTAIASATIDSANVFKLKADADANIIMAGGKFRLDWVRIHVSEVSTLNLDGALYLLEKDFTNQADSAAMAIAGASADTDLITVIDIPVAGWQVIGTSEVVQHIKVDEVFELSDSSADVTGQLFGALQAVNAHNPSGNSGVYTITLGITKL